MSENIFRSRARAEAQEHFLAFECPRIIESKPRPSWRTSNESPTDEGFEIHAVGAACVDGDGTLLSQEVSGGDGCIRELEVLDVADRIGTVRIRGALVGNREAAIAILDDGVVRAATGEHGEVIAVAAVDHVVAAAAKNRVVIHGCDEGIGEVGTEDVLGVAVENGVDGGDMRCVRPCPAHGIVEIVDGIRRIVSGAGLRADVPSGNRQIGRDAGQFCRPGRLRRFARPECDRFYGARDPVPLIRTIVSEVVG